MRKVNKHLQRFLRKMFNRPMIDLLLSRVNADAFDPSLGRLSADALDHRFLALDRSHRL